MTTSNTKGLRCPFCGHLHTRGIDLVESVPADDDAHEFECHDCERSFLASATITITYRGRPHAIAKSHPGD